MQNASRFIVVAGISSGCLSMLYFLSLVLHAPFFIAVFIIFVAVFLFSRWVTKGNENFKPIKTELTAWAYILLVSGVILMVQSSYSPAPKHGDWDAWAFWNLHAKYLADPLNWQKLFRNNLGDHPDYPLLVPGTNAFFIRLLGGNADTIVPFIFSFSIMLFIPVLVYLETARENIVIAAIVLLLFIQDTHYLSIGLAQYADLPLAFFFLCALVCMNHIDENKTNVVLIAASLGCSMWAKNEGIILSAIFILFNMRTLFSRRNARYFILGLSFPLMVLFVFKIFYAPQNDILSGQNSDTFNQLFMASRYETIYNYFSAQLDGKFYYVKIAFFSYATLCIIEKKWPGKQMLMLIACMVAYMMVYILSVQALEWHLATSIDRLMLQLMPAMMYIISLKFSEVQFSLPKKTLTK